MAKIDLQYDLTNYTPASASPVEANFNRIEQHVNQEVIERGGTVAMTAQLKLVGDPIQELDAAPKQYVDQVLPIGIVMMFGGSAVPPGGRWAICNGAELQSATYPALFAVIANNFSPGGTPAGRFHLPNLIDRMPLGSGGIAGLGVKGGSADATLPAHAHGGGSHTHGLENHTHGMKNHVHHFNHFHGLGAGATGGQNASHYHLSQNANDSLLMSNDNGNPIWIIADGGNRVVYAGHTNWESGDHAHGLVGSTVYVSQSGSGGVGGPEEGGSGNTRGPNDNTTDQPGGWGGPSAATVTTDSRGVSATNANLPPYIGMSYIMRVV